MGEPLQAQKTALERMNQIFKERETEFRLREENFNKKQNALSEKERLLKEQMEEVKKKQSEYDDKYAGLCKKEQEVKEELQKLKDEKLSLEEMKKQAEAQNEQTLMDAYILKEELQNERLKSERVREEYEHKIALLDPDMAELLSSRAGMDTAGMVKREEHESAIQVLKNQINELQGKLQVLQSENDVLIQDKQRLLKQLFFREKAGAGSGNGSRAEDVEKESQEEGALVSENSQAGTGDSGEASEELTASVLYNYLLKNEDGAKVTSRHSESAEQIFMERHGLTYCFVFASPAYFDIRCKRKKDRYIKNAMEKFNNEQSGVKFAYDETAGEVVATGYFTQEITAFGLMDSVNGIVERCFNEEGWNEQ